MECKLKTRRNTRCITGYNEIKEDYKIIDINKYSKEELLSDDLLISRGMAIEKSKTNEEFIRNLAEIAGNIRDKEIPYGEYFLDIIQRYILSPDIREEAQELIEKIKIKKGVNRDMLNIVRVQLEAYEACRKEGREEERENIVKALLKRKMPIEDIVDITGMTEEDVIKLQNEKIEA